MESLPSEKFYKHSSYKIHCWRTQFPVGWNTGPSEKNNCPDSTR